MGGISSNRGLNGEAADWNRAAHTSGPPKLYHASTAPIRDILEPRLCRTAAGEEGHFIFAAEDYTGAHAYALKTPEMLCIHYMPGFPAKNVHACVIRDRNAFLESDVQGTIYEVPADKFRRVYFANGEPSYEWVAEEPVEVDPDKITRVDLDTAMRAGVQVFFAEPHAHQSLVDQVYDPAWQDKRWDDSKLAAAWKSGKLIWENHLRGMNPFLNPELTDQAPALRA